MLGALGFGVGAGMMLGGILVALASDGDLRAVAAPAVFFIILGAAMALAGLSAIG